MTATQQNFNTLEITDCNINIDGDCNFMIEINDQPHTIYAPDFFAYLFHTERIAGHDPSEETAWVRDLGQSTYDHERQEMAYNGSCCTKSYELWLHEFVDNDEVLLDFMKVYMITKATVLAEV